MHITPEYIWGVVDTIPETNFPDIRNRTVIHSNNGSCMVIPREGDTVRLYIQLTEADVVTNGRVDRTKMDSKKLLAVCWVSCTCPLTFVDVVGKNRWQRSPYTPIQSTFHMKLIGGRFISVRNSIACSGFH